MLYRRRSQLEASDGAGQWIGGTAPPNRFEVSELLDRHKARLPIAAERGKVVYHDPCYLGRYRGVYDEPRSVLAQSMEVLEAPRHRERSFCCGAGGGQMFLGEEKGKRINTTRAEELVATGAETVAAACPFCASMFRDALKTVSDTPPQLLEDSSTT